MKKTFFSLVLFMFFLSGCATNYYVKEELYPEPKNYEKTTVYVTNPEHEAYDILKRSKIYELTDNPANQNKLTLTDFSSARGKGCGLGGYVLTTYMLGIFPYNDRSRENLAYTLEAGQSTHLYHHKIMYTHSTSIWSVPLRPFAYSKIEAEAKSLSLSKREICQDYKSCKSAY